MFQAGLSWLTILKKREAFCVAFEEGFQPAIVAAYGDTERGRLMADAGIVRNRLKVNTAIHNAAVVCDLAARHGSFAAWLDTQGTLERPPRSTLGWTSATRRPSSEPSRWQSRALGRR